MSCWMPSNSQEAWFPQLRINRLAKEKLEREQKEAAAAKTRRAKAAKKETEPAVN